MRSAGTVCILSDNDSTRGYPGHARQDCGLSNLSMRDGVVHQRLYLSQLAALAAGLMAARQHLSRNNFTTYLPHIHGWVIIPHFFSLAHGLVNVRLIGLQNHFMAVRSQDLTSVPPMLTCCAMPLFLWMWHLCMFSVGGCTGGLSATQLGINLLVVPMPLATRFSFYLWCSSC